MTPHYWLILITLYFIQGLPSGLIVHALPPLLRENGAPLELIGFMKLLALPWVLKFLWSPYVDHFYIPRIGAHRSWILTMQALVIISLLSLALISPDTLSGSNLALIFTLVFVINLFCATQDIATDGLAVKLLPEPLRGLGNSVQVSGYKIGLLIGGSAVLWGMDLIGWGATLALMAAFIFLCLVPTLLFNENRHFAPAVPTERPRTHHGTSWLWQQLRDFTQTPQTGYWLLAMGLYKVGDSLGSGMIKPMLVDAGFSLSQIANLTLLSGGTSIAAAFVGGAIYFRMGPRFCLLLFGILQGLALGGYALVDKDSTDMLVTTIALSEQAVDAISTVALFALMMDHCRLNHEGTDYTLQACIQVMVAGIGGVAAGFVAKAIGYEGLFITAMVVSWVCLLPMVKVLKNKRPGASTTHPGPV